MKRPARAPLTLAAALLLGVSGAAVDVIPSETTVAERVERMDAVLYLRAWGEPVVRAEDWRPAAEAANPDLSFPEPLLSPVIEQDVEVLEVLKGDSLAAAGLSIRIATSGGHNGLHLDSDWRRRTMAVGGTYVVFVQQLPGSEQLRYDRQDVFRLDGPTLTAEYETRYGKTLLGMSPSDALAFIRAAVANGRR